MGMQRFGNGVAFVISIILIIIRDASISESNNMHLASFIALQIDLSFIQVLCIPISTDIAVTLSDTQFILNLPRRSRVRNYRSNHLCDQNDTIIVGITFKHCVIIQYNQLSQIFF